MRRYWIDTGFIVFNEQNYPNFDRLLKRLDIGWQPSTMSFAVTDEAGNFEYASTSINGLFANRSHLASPGFTGWSPSSSASLSARELLRADDGALLG